MRKIFEIIFGVVAVVIAILVALYARDNYMSSVTLMQIPVPKADIEPYTLVDSSLFVMAEYPRALLVKNSAYATEMSDLVGRMTTTRLVAGLPVARSLVAFPKDFRLADPDKLVLSIPVSPENAVGGQLRIGERVNIYRIVVKDASSISLSGQAKVEQQTETSGSVEITATVKSQIPDLDELGTVKVQLVATVPVINILSSKGGTLGAQSVNDSSPSILGPGANQEEDGPVAILLVAVPREQAEDLMRLIGMTNKGGEMMWLSLAALDGEEQAQANPSTATSQPAETELATAAPTLAPTATLTPTATASQQTIDVTIPASPTLEVTSTGTPQPTATATPMATASCDPAYPNVCIPITTADLACKDISFRNFTVLAPDPHGFDQDGDGIGCESN